MTATPNPLEDPTWLHRAVCRSKDVDPELFFPEGNTGVHLLQIEEAKLICNMRCPVREECLTWALENKFHGVWGGYSEDERATLLRRRRKDAAKTEAAALAQAAA
ncbi:WhiB family transcriptional regulator [Kitasatospora sp. NPDC004272]